MRRVGDSEATVSLLSVLQLPSPLMNSSYSFTAELTVANESTRCIEDKSPFRNNA